jgi:hypothetical protein
MNTTIRVADADESSPKLNFEDFNRAYRKWLMRRGFNDEVERIDRFKGIAQRCRDKKAAKKKATK